jgi:hypothetical protein
MNDEIIVMKSSDLETMLNGMLEKSFASLETKLSERMSNGNTTGAEDADRPIVGRGNMARYLGISGCTFDRMRKEGWFEGCFILRNGRMASTTQRLMTSFENAIEAKRAAAREARKATRMETLRKERLEREEHSQITNII